MTFGQNSKVGPVSHAFHEHKSKWMKDWNIKTKTIKELVLLKCDMIKILERKVRIF